MAATYQKLLYDLRTNTAIDEVPLQGVRFNLSLNNAGQLTGQIPTMSDPGVKAAQLASLVIPGRQALYAYRNGGMVWGGILWQALYARSSDAWQFTAQTFMSYFARRRIRVDKIYSNADQLFVVQDLINYAQGVTGGNINVTVPNNTSGQLVSPTYNAYERRVIADEINTLSQASNGFDYEIDASGQPNAAATLALSLGYPRRGRSAGNTGLVFENPGNVTDYVSPNDASKMALTVDAVGANTSGNAGTPLIGTSSITSYIDSGWPLLEDVVSYKGANDPASLGSYANAQVATLGQPLVIPQVVVDPGIDPVLGQYIAGDEARFRLSGPMWPNGLDTYYRILDIAVTPSEKGVHETATLTLGPTLGY